MDDNDTIEVYQEQVHVKSNKIIDLISFNVFRLVVHFN
jgi:hypothetical protein